MRFAVGYQLYEGEDGEEPLVEIVRDLKAHVAEVYFPWGDLPSGRSPLTARSGYTLWGAQQRLEEDLRAFREMGIQLDLLFNANCYGGRGISHQLEAQVASVLDHLGEAVGGVDAVTTTSPMIARTVKRLHPAVQVRASVNMRIGTVQGMAYLADLFDSYYVHRELNRDPAALAELKAWADAEGKTLHLLVNSGCLYHCSGQTFHDNLVAHEAEVSETRNITDWVSHTCWRYLADPAHWPAVLQASWIRPEDLGAYEKSFPVVKLATRMHARPRTVLNAYATGRHYGNLLDLFEPSFAPVFAPDIIDNSRFPKDWHARTSTCDRRCHRCSYCAEVLAHVRANPATDAP